MAEEKLKGFLKLSETPNLSLPLLTYLFSRAA